MPNAQSIPLKQRTVIGLSVSLAVASYFIPQPEQSYQSPLLSPTTASTDQHIQRAIGGEPERLIQPTARTSSVATTVAASSVDKYLANAPPPRSVQLIPDGPMPALGPSTQSSSAPVKTPSAPTMVYSQDMFSNVGANGQLPQSQFLPVSQQELAK